MKFSIVLTAAVLAGGALSCSMATRAADAPAPTVAAAATEVLGAVGIGVKSLDASIAFYGDVLGLQIVRRFELGYLNEVVLGFPGGAGTSVVLMNWPNDAARRYDGNDVKLVFYVHDPAAVLERIRARGGRIDREAAPIETLGGTVIGVGRDPDNYVVELIAR